MKKILGLVVGVLLMSTNLYAGNGDLIVNGNVGIGTTSPTAKIDVVGSVNVSGANQFSGDVSGTKWYLGSFGNPPGTIKAAIAYAAELSRERLVPLAA